MQFFEDTNFQWQSIIIFVFSYFVTFFHVICFLADIMHSGGNISALV